MSFRKRLRMRAAVSFPRISCHRILNRGLKRQLAQHALSKAVTADLFVFVCYLGRSSIECLRFGRKKSSVVALFLSFWKVAPWDLMLLKTRVYGANIQHQSLVRIVALSLPQCISCYYWCQSKTIRRGAGKIWCSKNEKRCSGNARNESQAIHNWAYGRLRWSFTAHWTKQLRNWR